MDDFSKIILGSVLAFAGGLFAFFIQWWWNLKNQKKVVREFLKELLINFNRLVPRIVETYDKSGTLWNDLLNQIADDLTLYERNREHSIVLIQDAGLRGEIWEWFSKARSCVNLSYGLNTIQNDNPQKAWATQEIKKQVDKLKEYRSEAQKLMEKL